MKTEILIVGAGVGGLALAQYLKRNNFNFEIVERRESIEPPKATDSRNKEDGYSLTMQKQGVEVLKELGIYDRLNRIELFKNFGFLTIGPRVWANDGWSENFAIPRSGLLTKLREGIDVQNFDFERYEINDGIITVFAKDGFTIQCDVLIGCDGFKSEIRQQLLKEADIPDVVSVCNNMMLINGITKYNTKPIFSTIQPNSTYYWVDGKYRLFVKPYNDESFMWQLSFDRSEYNGPDPLTFSINLAYDKGWHKLPRSILKYGDRITVRTLHTSNPSILSKNRRKIFNRDITLLGDAAHTMPPYKGMGANMALYDAQLLAKKLMIHSSYSKALRAYEERMLEEGEFYVNASNEAVKSHHTDSVCRGLWSFDGFGTRKCGWVHLTRPLENLDAPELANVEKLVIDYPVTEIPEFVFKIKNLKYLRIVRNNLTSIPDEISELKYLKELHLRNNNISMVSHALGKLQHLHTLRLSSNNIYYLPSTFTDLTNLKHVCLSKNLLTYLPEDFSRMIRLKTFYFRNNPMKDVPITLVRIFMDRRVDFKC